jgi:hypothetical protein
MIFEGGAGLGWMGSEHTLPAPTSAISQHGTTYIDMGDRYLHARGFCLGT